MDVTKSPSAATNARLPPAASAGLSSGNVTRRKVAQHPAEGKRVVLAERRQERQREYRSWQGPGQREQGFNGTAELPWTASSNERAGDERHNDRGERAHARHPYRIHQRTEPLGLAE